MRNVWIINNGFGAAIETGEIDETDTRLTEDGQKYYVVHGTGDFVGTFGALVSNTFYSEKDCLDEYHRRQDAIKDDYREACKDVRGLVEFLYGHMECEEYTDYNARVVVEEKAKELLGIDLA